MNCYNKAFKFIEKGKYNDAIICLKKLKQTHEIIYLIASCHKEIGTLNNYKISQQLYIKILSDGINNKKLLNDTRINLVSVSTLLVRDLLNQFDYDNSLKTLFDCLKFCPLNYIILYNIGHVYKNIGDYDNAIKYLKLSRNINAIHIDTYLDLNNIYQTKHDTTKCLKYLNYGIKYMPYNATLYNELGTVFTHIGSTKNAFNMFDLAKKYCHEKKLLASISINLGHLHYTLGNFADGSNEIENAIKLDDCAMIARHNYLMDLLYRYDIDYNIVLKKHFEIGTIIHNFYQKNIQFIQPKKLPLVKHDKKRIGFISADFFGDHPMVHFLKIILSDTITNHFSLFCYSNNDHPLPELIKNYSKNISWRPIKFKSTAECLQLILNDNLDILFDLSGHTSGNRLDLFSYRIAPKQISYLGYPCITGMPNIDHFIIDKTFDYVGNKLLLMNNCYTHYTPPFVPTKLIIPYRKNNYITFGSLNKPTKLNNKLVQLWDSLLDLYPTAKLILKNNNNLTFKNKNRVIFIDLVRTFDDYIDQYNLFDIALDTFPYSGTTTTCESLLMGTPVITLTDRKNKTIHQNTTASLLFNSNLSELVANDENEFFHVINNIIHEISKHENYKKFVQHRFLSGNVTNRDLYTKNFIELINSL